ncbi:unnamed protein product [Eruca vesicaria subsp. sativa]|uniref:F-box domain-containing protein n=1 Tax=Eruca vesicaria subsp. sativa TaxID=29727 RepID=A0ABC8MBP0_ERUVS|nr:unnamed protein product [Eruca vesicaria subsp. sativa]
MMKRGSQYYPITRSSGSFVSRLLSFLKAVYAFLIAWATQRLHPTEQSPSVSVNNIPLDLVVEILKKLPAKSLVRFRCVSKEWSSIISSRRDFLDAIVARPLAQPQRMHFIFHYNCTRQPFFIFRSVNHKMADNQSIFIPELTRSYIYQYVRGLFLCWSYGCFKIFIYNPTTRQALWLPDQDYFMFKHHYTYFFGYDPLQNQYKILGLPKYYMRNACIAFTLTVPTTTKNWRYIESIGLEHHYPIRPSICINGVIYYQGRTTEYGWRCVLMSFDIRHEKFDQVNAPTDYHSSLLNYQGKLGLMCCYKGVEIWVMEHTKEKTQEWSKIFFYKEMVSFEDWFSKGVTRGGEIVFVYNRSGHNNRGDALCVSYYDPVRNSMRYEDIESISKKKLKPEDIIFKCAVIDHVENTMRLF